MTIILGRRLFAIVVLAFGSTTGALAQPSGSWVKFDGSANTYMFSPYDPGLNTLPMMVTTWFRSFSSFGQLVDGQGCSLEIYNSHLTDAYIRGLTNGVFLLDSVLPVTDGRWHHPALLVGSSDGKLYLDSMLKSSRGWTEPAGPSLLTSRIELGRYHAGDLDDVVLWKTNFSQAVFTNIWNQQRTGNEPNMLTYW